jgi:hypothetical protein
MNEILDARMSRGRGAASAVQWNGYSKLKREWASKIKVIAFHRRFAFVDRGFFTYLFIEPNKRRDKSNVIAGGIKLIEDALVEAKILANDGNNVVDDIRPYVTFGSDDSYGVLLVVRDDRVLERAEMLALAETELANTKREKKDRAKALRVR